MVIWVGFVYYHEVQFQGRSLRTAYLAMMFYMVDRGTKIGSSEGIIRQTS